jgi:chromosomal replication initiator protein
VDSTKARGISTVEEISGAAIWTTAKRHLADTLSKDVFERWIDVISFQELEGDRLILSVANDFYHTWLIENYLPLIRNAVIAASTQDLGIEFVVDRERGDVQPVEKDNAMRVDSSPRTGTIPSKRRQILVPALNHKYTFDRFVVGPSNSFAHAATLAVARSPGRAYNPLFIYGRTGLGKTHLMQAIGHYALADETNHATVCYLSTEAFTNEYIDALQRKELSQFRKKYRSIDVLLVDDIHFLAGKERLQEEFFHTFNTLFDSHKQIVMTSDRPASEIPGLEHRLVSRFEWGLVTELQAPDVETRIAILRKKQEQLELTLSPEILQYLAENIRSNIRRLEGGMIRVASYISLTGKELSVHQLNDLLKDSLDQEQQEAITMESIQRVVAEYHDIRFADMTSKRRPQSIAYPRQIAMYLCRTLTSHSFPEIGNAFDRNHATVLHACRLIKEREKEDPNLRKTLATLQQRLCHR